VGRRLCILGTAGTLGSANLEAVLEASGHGGEGSHAAGTGGLPALGLLGPVVYFPFVSAHPPLLLSSPLQGWAAVRAKGGCSIFTYTFGSWQQGSRKKRKCASGCAETGDLFVDQMTPSASCRDILDAIILFMTGGSLLFQWQTAVTHSRWAHATNHSDGTECASCCDAFRKSWFPSLFDLSVSRLSRWIEIVGQGGQTHFISFSGVKKKKGQYQAVPGKGFSPALTKVSHTTVDGLWGQR
jgi:hypothetical protein